MVLQYVFVIYLVVVGFFTPVMPGDTLDVKIWVDGSEALYQTCVGDNVVLSLFRIFVTGKGSGIELARDDALIAEFRDGKIVRVDFLFDNSPEELNGWLQREASRVILAPLSIPDCFPTVTRAFNLADHFQCPVIVVSDLLISEGNETVDPALLLADVEIDRGAPGRDEEGPLVDPALHHRGVLLCRECGRRAQEQKRQAGPGHSVSPPAGISITMLSPTTVTGMRRSGRWVGPFRTSPVLVYSLPWQGQTRCSAAGSTWQPRCMQRVETAEKPPSSSR